MNLRDALLQGLANLPGSRTFHVHALVSSPRKHSNLYPFASPRPKTFLQDVLVLLSEQAIDTPEAPRVFVSAIEASLYHVPSTSSAVLYVSKVDSTGQGASPSPTQALVRALLKYYVDPTTRPLPVARVWVHLFARAQNQYLFPNSSEYAGKRPLTDVVLCAWWKRQLSWVAEQVAARGDAETEVRLFHLLPGLGELEATHALERVYADAAAGSSVPWAYGHPYGQTEVALPCGSIEHIGHVIPWFDDDPKARFLDEIAYTTEAEGVRSPARKRARTSLGSHKAEEEGESGTERKEGTGEQARRLGRVSVEEFWERMSFRQECVAGAMTGFFVMATSSPTGAPASLSAGSAQAGEVPAQVVKRVVSSLMTGHEFPSVERAVWSTRVLEETIRGLCSGRAQSPEASAPPETPRAGRLICDGTYSSHVYGGIAVRNAEAPRKGAVDAGTVRVLAVRRKRRG